MESKFTWLPKFTKTLLSVPEEHQAALFRALVQYGSYGLEPEFEDWALKAVFESLREDIDNNKSFRSSGATGGRGNKKHGSERNGDEESPLEDTANAASECDGESETPLCEDGETEKRGSENPPSIPNQTIPNQTIPNQTIPNQEKSKRFAPPSVSEVREFCAEKGYAVDAEQFVAFYESKGWKVGRNPMKSWRAACTTWHKRHQSEQSGGGGNGDAYSAL